MIVTEGEWWTCIYKKKGHHQGFLHAGPLYIGKKRSGVLFGFFGLGFFLQLYSYLQVVS